MTFENILHRGLPVTVRTLDVTEGDGHYSVLIGSSGLSDFLDCDNKREDAKLDNQVLYYDDDAFSLSDADLLVFLKNEAVVDSIVELANPETTYFLLGSEATRAYDEGVQGLVDFAEAGRHMFEVFEWNATSSPFSLLNTAQGYEGFCEISKEDYEKVSFMSKNSVKTTKSVLIVDLLYRCGSNYKTYFKHEIDLMVYPEAKNLAVDDELTMGQFGTMTKEEFFGSEIHEYDYDTDLDHNLLDVTEILN